MTRRTPPIRVLLPAFSLIEILVAIGIVSLLVAIAIPVFSLARQTAESAQASAALAALESAEVEYESATGRRVIHLDPRASTDKSSAELYDEDNRSSVSRFFGTENWSSDTFSATDPTNGTPANRPSVNGNTDGYPEHFIERFIARIDQVESTKRVWRSVDEDLIADTDDDGFLEILDPWGTPVVYAAFVSHNDSVSSDDFLRQQGDLERVQGTNNTYVPKSPAPVFVSAGPDRDFGDVNGTDAQKAAAEDNLYSDTLGKGGN